MLGLQREPMRLLLGLLLALATLASDGLGKQSRGRSAAQKRGEDPEVDEHGISRRGRNGRAEASDYQRALLPDRGKKRVRRELKCSICVATVHEASLALPRFKTGRAAKEWELADALEDLCLELETYGLSLEWNVPTARYTNDPTIGRHKGNWIERHAVTVCGELLSEYEEELVSVLQPRLPREEGRPLDHARHAEAVELFCEQTVEVCLESDRDVLGDWEGDGVVEKYLTEDESNRLKNEAREPLKREVGDPVMDKHAKLPEGTTLREHLADKQAPRNYKVHDVQSMGDVGEL